MFSTDSQVPGAWIRKQARCSRLTIGDSHPHQKDGRGYDGEQDGHGDDGKDDGGIVDSCLGVVVAVRHGGLQHSFCLVCFQKITAGEVVAITRAKSCQCKPWRRSLQS